MPKQTPILPEEWDFERLIARHGLNDDQIYFCMTYEYAREIPGIVRKFERDKTYRKRIQPDFPWHCIVADYESDPALPLYVEIIDAPVGFPNRPFLSVFKGHKPSKESYKPLVFWEPVRAVERYDEARFQYNLYVDWNRSDKELTNSFAKWLRANRTEKPFERRGQNRARVHLSKLKALGAFRLMRALGTAQAALDFTISQGIGTGLYHNLSDWFDANKRAAAIIKLWRKSKYQFLEDL